MHVKSAGIPGDGEINNAFDMINIVTFDTISHTSWWVVVVVVVADGSLSPYSRE